MNYWDTAGRWINILLLFVVGVISFDTLFRLLEAQDSNVIVRIMRTFSTIFLVPFRGMFGDQEYVMTALVAVLGYALLAGIALSVLRGVQATRSAPRGDVRGTSTAVATPPAPAAQRLPQTQPRPAANNNDGAPSRGTGASGRDGQPSRPDGSPARTDTASTRSDVPASRSSGRGDRPASARSNPAPKPARDGRASAADAQTQPARRNGRLMRRRTEPPPPQAPGMTPTTPGRPVTDRASSRNNEPREERAGKPRRDT